MIHTKKSQWRNVEPPSCYGAHQMIWEQAKFVHDRVKSVLESYNLTINNLEDLILDQRAKLVGYEVRNRKWRSFQAAGDV